MIAVIANERSGSLIAGEIIDEIRRDDPSIPIIAGGSGTHRAGAERTLPANHQGSVTGLTGILGSLLGIRRDLRRDVETIVDAGVRLVVTVDYPGYHVRLSERLRKRGCRTIHVVSPQIWAWRSGRINAIRRAFDELVVIFPFEVDIYRRHGMAVRYFGNPLPDRLRRDDARRIAVAHEIRGEDRRPIVAWLPGSRPAEIVRHRDLIRSVVNARDSATERHIVASAPGIERSRFGDQPASVEFVEDGSAVLSAADAGIIKIGTGTLEAALLGLPQAAIYRASALTGAIARRLSKTPYLAMPNILVGRPAVPELVQESATPESVSETIDELLNPSSRTASAELRSEVSAILENGSVSFASSIAEFVVEQYRSLRQGRAGA